MTTTLIIMAAGIGSRFGGGIKQLAKMGPNGEIIMDYSIYDAVEAGFDKVVIIIRKDIEKEFKEAIGDRIAKKVKIEYVYQETWDIPEGVTLQASRTKPWGTGHALLCCKDVVKDPFVVINADDYYGKEIFRKLHKFLITNVKDTHKFSMGMGGFILENTLSENGTVTRGICQVDENEYLLHVYETRGIKALEDGKIICNDPEIEAWIHPKNKVSMNMWAGTPDFFDYLEEGFKDFFAKNTENLDKAEYLLPNIIEELLKEEKAKVKVLETTDRWFGITYREDKEIVEAEFSKLIEEGVYPKNLWG